ncbi:lamin tail domain-containing protein [Actinoplanes sp. NBC_00393]|uniref:lamin tail domain-containing protein n=1 Tax=Actinoplanes sp. NBC_00393 TaxID=2975953 RepID=UPI002E1B2CD0
MQIRPKAIFGASAAFGVITAAVLTAPSPAFAADAPTFDKIPVANGYNTNDKVVLTGTAEPGDTVTLYEDAYYWAKDFTVDQLKAKPANDYDKWIGQNENGENEYEPVTTVANSAGRWTITRAMDSGHIMMVGTDDGFSNRRYSAVRVQPVFTANVAEAGTVSFNVGVNPGQAGFPITIERYTSNGWTAVDNGLSNAAGWGNQVTGLPAGSHTFRAFVGSLENGESVKAGYADPLNLIIANYSINLRVDVPGSPATNGPAPSEGNPVPNPAIADPDGGPVDNPNPTNPSPSPSRSSANPSPSPSKPTTTPPKPTTPPAPPAPAVGSVQFTRIQFNAPGKDTKKNKSLNGEYFRITNKTKKTINLKGWTVRDAAGNLYRFTTTLNLRAANSVIVRTGKGTSSSSLRYWGRTSHVWNNGGDTAYLRTGAGKTIDTCRWTKPGKGYTVC